MDYNSRPWEYEIVGIEFNGDRYRFKETDKDKADKIYQESKSNERYQTVLFSHSRKGHALGQYEI
jgi:hypothetical protein